MRPCPKWRHGPEPVSCGHGASSAGTAFLALPKGHRRWHEMSSTWLKLHATGEQHPHGRYGFQVNQKNVCSCPAQMSWLNICSVKPLRDDRSNMATFSCRIADASWLSPFCGTGGGADSTAKSPVDCSHGLYCMKPHAPSLRAAGRGAKGARTGAQVQPRPENAWRAMPGRHLVTMAAKSSSPRPARFG